MPSVASMIGEGTFLLLALLTFVEYIRNRRQARFETAAMFGAFAIVIVGAWISRGTGAPLPPVGRTLVLVSFMAAPFFLIRLTHQLHPLSALARGAGLVGFVVSSLLLTILPSPVPEWVMGIVVAYFAYAEGYPAYVFVRGAIRTAGVTRWRMLFAAWGSGLLGGAITLSGAGTLGPLIRDASTFLYPLLTAAAGIAYFFAFAPPAWLRRLWQVEETHRFLLQAAGYAPDERRNRILHALPEATVRSTGATSAAIALLSGDGATREVRSGAGRRGDEVKPLHVMHGVAAEVLRRGEPILAGPEAFCEGEARLAEAAGAHALLALPLASPGQTRGVLLVFYLRAPLFVRDDLALLTLFAEEAALTLEHAKALEDLETHSRALEAREEAFRTIARNADGVVVLDADGLIRYANPAADALFGKGGGGLTGECLDVPLAIGKTSEVEIPRGAEGATLAEVRMVKTTWEGRDAVLASFRDITERKAAEEALRQSEARLRSLLETVPAFITTVGPDRRILFINREADGLDASALLGASIDEVVPEPERAAIAEALRRVFDQGESVIFEATFPGPDGTPAWFENHAGPVVRGGKVVAATVVSLEVTERKRLEQEAEEQREAMVRAERLTALGTLVAGVAHEVNNPLVYVRGNIETCLRLLVELEKDTDLAQDPDRGFAGVERRMRTALAGAERIGRIVKSLRVVARQDSTDRTTVDLNEIVREVEDLVNLSLPGRTVLTVHTQAEPLLLWANPSALHQAVLNLVKNALEAAEEGGGTVRVETRLTADGAEVLVADDGPGIPKDVRKRLFTPFLSTKPTGTGLGLSIVHAIAREHGGEVHLLETSEKGTRFALRLPKEDGASRHGNRSQLQLRKVQIPTKESSRT